LLFFDLKDKMKYENVDAIHPGCPLKKILINSEKFGLSFSVEEKTFCMDTRRNQDRNNDQQTDQTGNNEQDKQHSSAFKETSRGDEKSTTNIEEAELEQERKEAMRERD